MHRPKQPDGLIRLGDIPPELRAEFAAGFNNHAIGTRMVHQTGTMTVWHMHLAPGDRIAAHCHDKPYFWTVMTDGFGRSRYADGSIVDIEYKAGDTKSFDLTPETGFVHDLENTGETELLFVTVEFEITAN